MTRLFAVALFALVILGTQHQSHAVPIVYTAELSGLAEFPPNASSGTGFVQVDFDIDAHTMRVRANFSGLVGPTSAAHIHAPPLNPNFSTMVFGVATQTPSFTGFPLGVASGIYDRLFDTDELSTYNPAYITATGGTAASAESALFAALNNGFAYFNIHTTAFPGGEVRGFFAVPEPGSLALLGVALGAFGLSRRRRKP